MHAAEQMPGVYLPEQGKSVDLEVIEGVRRGTTYLVTVTSTDGAAGLSVTAPHEGRMLAPIRAGDKVKVFFSDRKFRYDFVSEVVDRDAVNIPVLQLSGPSRIHSSRRTHMRVQVRAPVTCRVLTRLGDRPPEFAGEAIDVSVGGIRFVTSQPLPEGTLIEVTVRLREHDGVVKAQYEVRHVGNRPGPRPMKILGCRTTMMHREDRDRLARFITDRTGVMV